MSVVSLPYFEKARTAEFDRSKAANKTFVWIWFVSTALLGTVITNWNYRSDENYDIFSKIDKMLWSASINYQYSYQPHSSIIYHLSWSPILSASQFWQVLSYASQAFMIPPSTRASLFPPLPLSTKVCLLLSLELLLFPLHSFLSPSPWSSLKMIWFQSDLFDYSSQWWKASKEQPVLFLLFLPFHSFFSWISISESSFHLTSLSMFSLSSTFSPSSITSNIFFLAPSQELFQLVHDQTCFPQLQ